MKVRETDKSSRRVRSKKEVPLPDLSRIQPRQISNATRRPSEFHEPVDRKVLLDRANELFAARRLRPQIFGKAMFGETGWDLLLALYICGQAGGASLSSLTRFVGAPQTTVIRWLDYLESRGLVDRDRAQTNRKQANVQITNDAREALDAYLVETLREV